MRDDPQHHFWCALTDHDYVHPPEPATPICRRCGCTTCWPARKTLGRLIEDGLRWLARRLRRGDEIPFVLAALALAVLLASPAVAGDLIFADGFEFGTLSAWSETCPQPSTLEPILEIDVGPPAPGQMLLIEECQPVILKYPWGVCPFLYIYDQDGMGLDFGDVRQSVLAETGTALLLGIQLPHGSFWMTWGEGIGTDYANPVPGCEGNPFADRHDVR